MTSKTTVLVEDPTGRCEICGDPLSEFHYECGDERYHSRCWWEERGFEHIDSGEDRPFSSHLNRAFNYRREVTTELGDETITWTEWVCADPSTDDNTKLDLPNRDELTPEQLEQLRIWAEKPREEHDGDAVGAFPAKHVLFEGGTMPEVWICPDCGELVEPNEDLRAQCSECGSDEWLTRGEMLDDIEVDEPLSILSPDERAAVIARVMTGSDESVAEQLDADPAVVRQHLERARRIAKNGHQTYDMMVRNGIIEAESD